MSNFNHYNVSEEYKRAKQAEYEVMEFFKRKKYKVREATKKEQIEDIDVVIEKNNEEFKISVKNSQATCKTGNLFLEYKNNEKPSWWIDSKADFITFKVKDTHFFFDIEDLRTITEVLIFQGKIESKSLTNKQNYTNKTPQNLLGYCVPLNWVKPFVQHVFSVKKNRG